MIAFTAPETSSRRPLRRIRTRVTVTLANSAGLTSEASKLITLRAPKR